MLDRQDGAAILYASLDIRNEIFISVLNKSIASDYFIRDSLIPVRKSEKRDYPTKDCKRMRGGEMRVLGHVLTRWPLPFVENATQLA